MKAYAYILALALAGGCASTGVDFRDTVSEAKDEEEWDELEKSIVANLADEISIGIKKNRVEMVIYKKI